MIDVGAFSGDSAIYFAWRGAKKVYAFEPIPAAYEMAVDNIRLNGITNIEIFNEAIDYAEGELVLDKNQSADRSFSMLKQPKVEADGKRIHVRSFESMISGLRLDNAVLKMDCEGCEYEVLLNVENSSASIRSDNSRISSWC
ncbi:MAG: FkbM family methyltransferase [Candidatus Parvarchaeota archaeon]